jgi:hypothetical protein
MGYNMNRYRIIIAIIALLSGSMCPAQSFDSNNSISRKAFVFYRLDNGFYKKEENVMLDRVISVKNIYAYNKKSHELYCSNEHGNYVIVLNDYYAKIYKKLKTVPQLKADEIPPLVEKENQKVIDYNEAENEKKRQKIAIAKAKAKADSLEKVRQDSLAKIAEAKRIEDYRNTHTWSHIPTNKQSLWCTLCEKNISTKETVIAFALRNDSIYWGDLQEGKLYNDYLEMHVAQIPYSLKGNSEFKTHLKVFRDSLESRFINQEICALYNYKYFNDYLIKLRKDAPNGLFLKWGWDDDFSVSFHFNYLNTNKKTIKYIEVFFVITNAVGDVRKSGSFKGTGPLKEWESASWEWDSSHYYVAGDASNMSISKVIITYMDGTRVTIPKNKLRFD